MPTNNPRINVTFNEEIVLILSDLAIEEGSSVAGLVRKLTLEALEMREDLELSKLGDKLDKDSVKTYSHDEVWK